MAGRFWIVIALALTMHHQVQSITLMNQTFPTSTLPSGWTISMDVITFNLSTWPSGPFAGGAAPFIHIPRNILPGETTLVSEVLNFTNCRNGTLSFRFGWTFSTQSILTPYLIYQDANTNTNITRVSLYNLLQTHSTGTGPLQAQPVNVTLWNNITDVYPRVRLVMLVTSDTYTTPEIMVFDNWVVTADVGTASPTPSTAPTTPAITTTPATTTTPPVTSSSSGATTLAPTTAVTGTTSVAAPTPQPTPADTDQVQTSSTGSNNTGLIVGLVILGIVLCCCVLLLIMLFMRRRKQRKAKPAPLTNVAVNAPEETYKPIPADTVTAKKKRESRANPGPAVDPDELRSPPSTVAPTQIPVQQSKKTQSNKKRPTSEDQYNKMPSPVKSSEAVQKSPATKRKKTAPTEHDTQVAVKKNEEMELPDDEPEVVIDTNYGDKKLPKQPSLYKNKKNTLKRFQVVLDAALQIKYAELAMQNAAELGSGAFGIVYKASYKGNPVAVKELRTNNLAEVEVKEFVKEAVFMYQMKPHTNVVAFLGIVQTPFCIVSEFCERGDLYTYLQSETKIIPALKMSFVRDIAAGMQHIAAQSLVHRDLAARNVLLDSAFTAKVSDFGLSRMVAEKKDVVYSKGDVGPLLWMAPEAIKKKKYSEKSDVWSFGVTCYEIMTRQLPYENLDERLDPVQVATSVASGELRPTFPSDTPAKLLRVLDKCFNMNFAERPTFAELYELLAKI